MRYITIHKCKLSLKNHIVATISLFKRKKILKSMNVQFNVPVENILGPLFSSVCGLDCASTKHVIDSLQLGNTYSALQGYEINKIFKIMIIKIFFGKIFKNKISENLHLF